MNVESEFSTPNNGRWRYLHKSIGMNGGQGPQSYAKNSRDQGRAAAFFYDVLREAIQKVDLLKQMPVRVADFGCSSGPNCIYHMDNITAWFREQADERHSPLEIQYFFSDLPSTDFNNLFRMLANKSREELPFVSGVAGSFAIRLLPKGSINLGISTFALHWLTKVPEEVSTKSSPAWNEGHLSVHGSKPEVAQAYAEQSMTDLRNCLRSRAEELVPGGLLFLLFFGRASDDPAKQMNESSIVGLLNISMQKAWTQLISEGVINAEEGSSINIPIYHRSEKEVRDVVEKEFVHEFSILKLERVEKVPIVEHGQEVIEEPIEIAIKLGAECRALTRQLFVSQIGEKRAELFFQRIEENLLDISSKVKIDMGSFYDVIFTFLERK